MTLSVIIPTYNRNRILCNTISSVISSYENANVINDMELIIVDQTSNHDEETVSFLERLKQVNYISCINVQKASLPNARNIGIKESKGDIILFLDDDVILQKDFFENLLSAYKDKRICSVVGRVKLVDENNGNILLQNQSSLKRFCRKILKWGIGQGKPYSITSFGFILSDTGCTTSGIVDGGRGCCMSFRRSVFDSVGLFDTNYIGNSLREETDLFCRMKKAGMQVYFDSNVFLHHVMANTGGCRNDEDIEYWQKYFFNQCYFYIKNFRASINKIKLILIFDLWKCYKYGIKPATIIKDCYSNAKSIYNKQSLI